MNGKNLALHFCTIASGNYLPLVKALWTSLQRQMPGVVLHALVTDGERLPGEEGLYQYGLADLQNVKFLDKIVHQYNAKNDYLRWALKPVFLCHLLQKHERVVYVDNDITFFAPAGFLFEQLKECSLLLTPHWFSQKPYPQPENFSTAFQIGLFNAGFIGASQAGITFLQWWAEACLYRMERAEGDGFYDDQRYLDMAPLLDPKTCIVRHLGCNVGSWNLHQNKRVNVGGEVKINGQFPIVFVHFNHETIKHITNGNDGLLRPYLAAYEKDVAATGHRLEHFVRSLPDWKQTTPLQNFVRRTRIRTRIKSWLFRLSQKL